MSKQEQTAHGLHSKFSRLTFRATGQTSGYRTKYAFDDIGNRTSTKAGGDQNGWNLRSASYGANLLNQYTNRTVPRAADIIGVAIATNSVTVNGQTAYRHGEYFWKEWTTNENGTVYAQITVQSGSSTEQGHLLLPPATQEFQHDYDGNLTQDGLWVYTWDSENRLVAMESDSSVPDAAKQKLEFRYDDQGRRIEKVVSSWDAWTWTYAPQSTNRFVYDGWNLVGAFDHTNGLVQSFAWGTDLSGSMQGAGGVGGLLAITIPSGTNAGTYLYAYDGNGNVVELVNATNGAFAARYQYGPFGETLRSTGPIKDTNRICFSTKHQDGKCSLAYFGFRYYDPITGRWLNQDPAEGTEPPDDSAVADRVFVANDPGRAIDYLGLWNEDIHFGGTSRWAVDAGYPSQAANRVADGDNQVDKWTGPTSFRTEPGTMYHFNRSLSMGTSEDTRIIKYREHVAHAQAFCTIAKGFDYPEAAAWQLGMALHPYQDWAAHGDHNYYLLGSFELKFRYRHNYMSPAQKSYLFPDAPALDAVGSL